jgi:hypothetical protein
MAKPYSMDLRETAAIEAGVASPPASARMVRVTLSRSLPERSIYAALNVTMA